MAADRTVAAGWPVTLVVPLSAVIAVPVVAVTGP
jgi:hypothetical protein